MIDGKRVTITSDKLTDLRKQENELLCKIDKGWRLTVNVQKEH